MEVPLLASFQDDGEGSFPGGTLDTEVDQASIEGETGTGPQSKGDDLSRKYVHPQEPDQEEMVVAREGPSSALERDAMKIETEKLKGKGKTYAETDSTLVQTSEISGKGKEQALGEGMELVRGRSEMKSDEGRKGQDARMSGQGDEEELKKVLDQTAKEGGILSTVDEKQGNEQEKMGNTLKHSNKGDEDKQQGKKETGVKKTENISGQPDVEKKKKKDKKHKSSSERILKKLEKINAKVGRILAKKEEYEVRLKEALEREKQESEKTAPREPDASTVGIGKSPSNRTGSGMERSPSGRTGSGLGRSPSDRTGSGLIREETILKNELRLEDLHESTKDGNKLSTERGLSGSLSRTASLIEVSPSELMEEVAGQKKLADKLAKILVTDGSETNPPLPTEDVNPVTKGKGEDLTLRVDGSIDNGAS